MALISFAVTAKLICAFVFASAKIRFSHDTAHISILLIVTLYSTDTRLRDRIARTQQHITDNLSSRLIFATHSFMSLYKIIFTRNTSQSGIGVKTGVRKI